MAKTDKKQEAQAAAEERHEVQEVASEDSNLNIGDVTAPEDAQEELTSNEQGNDVEGDDATTGSDRTTKAGKRSAKAQREADEELVRKSSADKADEPTKPRQIQKPNPLKRHGKNYRAAQELVDRSTYYELAEAVKLAKDTAKTKFDASIELHMNLGVDPRQADQMVRATVTLPAGTGKKLRIAVLAPSEKHAEAQKAGADIISDGDLIETINKGTLEFDVLISTPDMMARLSKAAKVLGPRGLMPNPKSGTVTPKVGEAVEQAKAGRVEFRIDKQAIVHLAIGKASFEAAKLEDNLKTAIDAVLKAKPAAAKGTYIKSISIAASMGPGIKLDVQKAIAASHAKR